MFPSLSSNLIFGKVFSIFSFEKIFFDKNFININIYKTDKVTKRLNTFKFIEHCLKGQKIKTPCEI